MMFLRFSLKGRRVVNNIARIAPISWVKTTAAILTMIYRQASVGNKGLAACEPAIPVQITLFDQFVWRIPR